MIFYGFSLNNYTRNIDSAQPSLSSAVSLSKERLRLFILLFSFSEEISHLFHRCWKISNQSEAKTQLVITLKYVKEKVPDCVYSKKQPKMITKEIDDTTHQYYKSLEEVKIRIKKLKLSLNWIVDVSEDVMNPSEYVYLFTVQKF